MADIGVQIIHENPSVDRMEAFSMTGKALEVVICDQQINTNSNIDGRLVL